jgi:hypothetical protein
MGAAEPEFRFNYDDSMIDPVVLSGDAERILNEPAEQIYAFKLFSDRFCRLLIDAAEQSRAWQVRGVLLNEHPYAPGLRTYYCPEMGFPDKAITSEALPGFADLWGAIVRTHIEPLLGRLWPVFKMQRIDAPYLVKYEPSEISGMGDHFDLETVSIVVYLNSDFEGGGTYFPRWNFSTAGQPTGTAILFPGGISHVHRGLRITDGTRYILNGAFF